MWPTFLVSTSYNDKVLSQLFMHCEDCLYVNSLGACAHTILYRFQLPFQQTLHESWENSTPINSHKTLVLVWLGHESWENSHANFRSSTLINSHATLVLIWPRHEGWENSHTNSRLSTLMQLLFSFDQDTRVKTTLIQTLACQLSCNSCSRLTRTWNSRKDVTFCMVTLLWRWFDMVVYLKQLSHTCVVHFDVCFLKKLLHFFHCDSRKWNVIITLHTEFEILNMLNWQTKSFWTIIFY